MPRCLGKSETWKDKSEVMGLVYWDVYFRYFIHLLYCLQRIEMIYYEVQKCH